MLVVRLSCPVGKGLSVVSLGQGQGPVAEALVHMAMKSGDWVCLQVRLPHRQCLFLLDASACSVWCPEAAVV
jgi:hypothetical protein